MTRTLHKILLVDDEPDILTVVEIALTQVGGFEVQAYSCSQTAVDQVESFMPDLIILDVMMPKMDGLQTLQQLRSIDSLKDTPVIFMTAKAQRDEVDAYKSAGAVGVIKKPLDPMKLSDEVRDIWDKSGLNDAE